MWTSLAIYFILVPSVVIAFYFVKWLGGVVFHALGRALVWALSPVVRAVLIPAVNSTHRRLEARFGKRFADIALWSLPIAAMFAPAAIQDWRTFSFIMVKAFLLCGAIALGVVSLALAGTLAYFLFAVVGTLLQHVLRWLRWFTTAYLRDSPPPHKPDFVTPSPRLTP